MGTKARYERLPLSAIFEDGNIREDYGAVEHLARTFKDGEPDEPIIVYQDCGIYKIVDGHRRVSAMKMLGTVECDAKIIECPTNGEKTMTQLRTGTTAKELDTIEKSRGYQAAIMFDVPTLDIAAVQGVDEQEVERFKRAVKKVGDYASDMSFERLLFIEDNNLTEEQEWDIMTAPENAWRKVAKEFGTVREFTPKEICPVCGAETTTVNWDRWEEMGGCRG